MSSASTPLRMLRVLVLLGLALAFLVPLIWRPG